MRFDHNCHALIRFRNHARLFSNIFLALYVILMITKLLIKKKKRQYKPFRVLLFGISTADRFER